MPTVYDDPSSVASPDEPLVAPGIARSNLWRLIFPRASLYDGGPRQALRFGLMLTTYIPNVLTELNFANLGMCPLTLLFATRLRDS